MKLTPKAQAALNSVVERFQSGDLSPIVEVACIRLNPDAPASHWSFNNQVLAYAQTDNLDCRGFRQWQEKGRTVQKGESAAYIFAPLTHKVKEQGDEKERMALHGFKGIPVFPYTATAPLPGTEDEMPLPYEPTEPPPLAGVAERLGIDVRYHPLPPDRRGDCKTDGSQINVGTHDVKTFFHELAHAVHARVNGGKLNGGQEETQETLAEFTACVLMELYGYEDRSGNAWRYIAGYSDDPMKAVMKALDTVGKVLAVIEENGDN